MFCRKYWIGVSIICLGAGLLISLVFGSFLTFVLALAFITVGWIIVCAKR